MANHSHRIRLGAITTFCANENECKTPKTASANDGNNNNTNVKHARIPNNLFVSAVFSIKGVCEHTN